MECVQDCSGGAVRPRLAPIFRSDAQARLLAALLIAGDELSLTALAAQTNVSAGSAHREVARLLQSGILRERFVHRAFIVGSFAARAHGIEGEAPHDTPHDRGPAHDRGCCAAFAGGVHAMVLQKLREFVERFGGLG